MVLDKSTAVIRRVFVTGPPPFLGFVNVLEVIVEHNLHSSVCIYAIMGFD